MQNSYAPAQVSNCWRGAVGPQHLDEDLLGSIADGDAMAMRTLFARHNVRVYRYVRRIIHDASKAEDIVSEVFFDVWRQAGSFKGRSKVSTWVLANARFKALSALRKRRDQPLDNDIAEAIEDNADNPEVALQKKDDSILLGKCLKQLSPKHREIIDLVYYHEMSVEEVAGIIGVPRNTVKTRMFYARKRIATLLAASKGHQAQAG